MTFALVLGGSALLALSAMVLMHCLRKWQAPLGAVAVRYSLNAKLKIVISFYQVAAAMPLCFRCAVA